jgi:hypothetical protein
MSRDDSWVGKGSAIQTWQNYQERIGEKSRLFRGGSEEKRYYAGREYENRYIRKGTLAQSHQVRLARETGLDPEDRRWKRERDKYIKNFNARLRREIAERYGLKTR